MFTEILFLALSLVAVQATGDFIVLHSPDSVKFKGDEEVPQSLLPEICSLALGFTAKQRGEWTGVSILDPFTLPEAVVVVAIEGVESISSSRGKHFPLNVDEVEETTWQALSGRLEERDDSSTLIRIYLGDGVDALGQSALGELKLTPIDESSLKSLSLKNKVDTKFLEEIQLLNAISKKVRSTITADNKPDVYWFVLSGLPDLLDFHGDDSAAAKESYTLLNDAMSRLTDSFITVYSGEALVTAFTNEVSHVRHTRATEEEISGRADNITDSAINVSKAYDESYPVIFNIFLWFGVAFLLALIAVCITIADMDPGRDSIIYRMTSNRMKKDN